MEEPDSPDTSGSRGEEQFHADADDDPDAQAGAPKTKLLLFVVGGIIACIAALGIVVLIALAGRSDGGPGGFSFGRTVPFGEVVVEGDLRIKVVAVRSQSCGGQYYGQYRNKDMMLVVLAVENTSKSKIVKWPGWQGEAKLEDEHGNKFKPINLNGWSALPGNDTLGGGWDGDTGTRIHPGKTYTNATYHEFAPESSRQAFVTVDFNGTTLRFSGPITHK